MKNFVDSTLEFEDKFLSRYAAKSVNSLGRDKPCESDGLRTEFQRDRDRILHCKAFRRLKHKTQMFLSPEGDHYRTRLTHTLEVSQIARTIARALKLNEDLTEAIALGHDLGHTPYGHAGERALQYFTHFEHNEQSLRIVEFLEYDGKGMNLTKEVRDGILNHTSRGKPSTVEGMVVSWSDRIAYINHDIDDAIRAKVLSDADLPKIYVDAFGKTISARINTMVMDIITNSFDKPFAAPSQECEKLILGLREFLFKNVYFSPKAKSEEGKAIEMIKFLYRHYYENTDLIHKSYINENVSKEQQVCDFIAMMTDNYAVKVFEEICIPKSWTVL